MRDPAPWQTKYTRMVGYALLFGCIGQYLLVGAAAGLSVPLFIACFYALFLYAVQGRIGGFERWRGQLSSGWLLSIPIVMLALSYAIFAGELFRWLNTPALFALIVAQTVLLTRSSERPWHRGAFYGDLLFLSMIRPIFYLTTPFKIVYDRLRLSRGAEGDSGKRGTFGKIGLGLLLAAPLLLVIISLLASADSIFSAWVNNIPNRLEGMLSGEVVFRFIAGGVIGWYAFCYIWSLMFRIPPGRAKTGGAGGLTETEAEPSDSELWKPYRSEPLRIDPVTASTFLVCINAVYVLFTVIQFSYLFGAADGLLPEGVAYAEYARRGFAELVLVALLNIALLLAGLHGIRRAGVQAERIRKLLLTVLIGCTAVMLVSAFSRLSLYEDAYGFTHTRLLVHGFMIFLGVLLAVAVYRIWRESFSLGKVYIAVSIAAYLVMNYINIDAMIANKNIDRYEQSGQIDLPYMAMLSADAMPALERLRERHPKLAGLDDILRQMRADAKQDHRWQSWNWSKWRAGR